MQKISNTERNKWLEVLSSKVVAGTLVAALTGTIAWAYNVQQRLTVLETALISVSSDIHDIKLFLISKPR